MIRVQLIKTLVEIHNRLIAVGCILETREDLYTIYRTAFLHLSHLLLAHSINQPCSTIYLTALVLPHLLLTPFLLFFLSITYECTFFSSHCAGCQREVIRTRYLSPRAFCCLQEGQTIGMHAYDGCTESNWKPKFRIPETSSFTGQGIPGRYLKNEQTYQRRRFALAGEW